jgi:16S rRNA (uracil1498-N3)-methyltransferase
MHRLLAKTEDLSQENPALSREALGHLKVLRPRDGEEIELFDGRGLRRVYSYSRAAGGLVAARPAESSGAKRLPLVLFACVTKGSRWDWTVEKATELGVSKIVPVVSERTIVRIPQGERAAKRERWMRIAEEAARQSDAAWLPEISEAVDFPRSVELAAETDCFVGALVDPPAKPLLAAYESVPRAAGRDVSLFVGPEGDFTPAELASLLAVATPTSFGPTVLRAETAALFGISVLAAALARGSASCERS